MPIRSLEESNAETESRKVGARCWERRNGESVFPGDGVSVWEGGKVPEMDGSDGCTTVWPYGGRWPVHLEVVTMARLQPGQLRSSLSPQVLAHWAVWTVSSCQGIRTSLGCLTSHTPAFSSSAAPIYQVNESLHHTPSGPVSRKTA